MDSTVVHCKTFFFLVPDKVTYLGPKFSLKCTESGLFDMTGKVPQCRTPITCPVPPSPPENSLLESLSTFVTEWSSALYRCRNGSKLPDDWTENVVDGNFTVLCGADVSYQVHTILATQCLKTTEKVSSYLIARLNCERSELRLHSKIFEFRAKYQRAI